MSLKKAVTDRLSVWGELWLFVRRGKRYWLLPLIAVIVLMSIFILATESSALAPFIYSIF